MVLLLYTRTGTALVGSPLPSPPDGAVWLGPEVVVVVVGVLEDDDGEAE
jgi:hypothetical protein